MRERLRNALRGFGFIADAEREHIIKTHDSLPLTQIGTNIVSQWGVGKTLLDPKAKGKL